MALYKAVKLEVMIFTEMEMSDEDIVKWTEDAMRDYCDFRESVVKIVEKHENVLHDMDAEAKA